jgi:hypothetical protein
MSGSHKPRQSWRHRVCTPHPCNTVLRVPKQHLISEPIALISSCLPPTRRAGTKRAAAMGPAASLVRAEGPPSPAKGPRKDAPTRQEAGRGCARSGHIFRTPRAVEEWRMIRSGHDFHLSVQAAGLGRYGSGADLAKGWLGAGCMCPGLAAPTLHNSLWKYNKSTTK